jgi:hypothetical protein
MDKPDSRFALANVIEDLRGELLYALAKGQGSELQFRLKPIDLELKLAVTAGGDGKAGREVLGHRIGRGGGKYEQASTHTLKLVLEPIGPDGGPVQISSRIANDTNPSQVTG